MRGNANVIMQVKRELKTKEKQTKQNEKIPKTFVSLFTEYEFD